MVSPSKPSSGIRDFASNASLVGAQDDDVEFGRCRAQGHGASCARPRTEKAPIFIPIAEETGQIAALGAWILEEACRQHAAWLSQGCGRIPISVNVSSIQLHDAALAQTLQLMLLRHGIEAPAIELELTESFLMENAIATVELPRQ